MSSRAIVVYLTVFLAAAPRSADAERVGFQFQGTLLPPLPGAATVFGIDLPASTYPVVGTFSYDVPVSGVEVGPGEKRFPEYVHGGLSLRIGDELSLLANEFAVGVSNDFDIEDEYGISDVFSILFERDGQADQPELIVNGEAWPLAGIVIIHLIWSPETFPDFNEPQLTPDRPTVPGRSSIALLGSSVPRFFSIDSISAIPREVGDYNRNGAVDANDYAEWKRLFGKTCSETCPTDGNDDHIVDAADYVIWRDHFGSVGRSEALNLVPEPAAAVMIAAIIGYFVAFRMDRTSWAVKS